MPKLKTKSGAAKRFKATGSGRIDNGELCRAWADVIRGLQAQQMAHGDLQQGNILVLDGGRLKLVDYDGLFVPEMKRLGLK